MNIYNKKFPLKKMIQEFNNLIDFSRYLGLPTPRDMDFEVSSLDSYQGLELDILNETSSFRHRFFSVCLATQLDMELSIGYYKRKPKAPFLTFKSPFQTMSWQMQPGMKKGVHIVFSENFMTRHQQLTNIVYEFPFLQINKTIPLEIEEKEVPELMNIFRQIEKEYATALPDRFDMIASLVHILLVRIRRLYEKSVTAEAELSVMAKSNDHTLFNRFKELLEQKHINQDESGEINRTVNFYADKLAVHPNYLNAVVKRVIGKNVLNIIHEHIISNAKILLLQTNLSIKEIAYQLSFGEPTHFGSFFKKYTGLTPVEFRKQTLI